MQGEYMDACPLLGRLITVSQSLLYRLQQNKRNQQLTSQQARQIAAQRQTLIARQAGTRTNNFSNAQQSPQYLRQPSLSLAQDHQRSRQQVPRESAGSPQQATLTTSQQSLVPQQQSFLQSQQPSVLQQPLQSLYDQQKQSIQALQQSLYDQKQSIQAAKQPRYDQQQSSQAAQQPRYDQQQSSQAAQQPRYDQQPSSQAAQQPQYDQQPSSQAAQQPLYDQPQSSQAAQQPRYDQQQSSQAAQQPRYDQQQSSQAAQQPLYDQQQSSQAAQQPLYDQQQSSQAAEKPLYDQQQSSQAAQQPLYDQQQSSQAAQQPLYDQQQSSQAAQQPLYDQQQSSQAAQQPLYDQQPSSQVSQASFSDQSHLTQVSNLNVHEADQLSVVTQQGVSGSSAPQQQQPQPMYSSDNQPLQSQYTQPQGGQQGENAGLDLLSFGALNSGLHTIQEQGQPQQVPNHSSQQTIVQSQSLTGPQPIQNHHTQGLATVVQGQSQIGQGQVSGVPSAQPQYKQVFYLDSEEKMLQRTIQLRASGTASPQQSLQQHISVQPQQVNGPAQTLHVSAASPSQETLTAPVQPQSQGVNPTHHGHHQASQDPRFKEFHRVEFMRWETTKGFRDRLLSLQDQLKQFRNNSMAQEELNQKQGLNLSYTLCNELSKFNPSNSLSTEEVTQLNLLSNNRRRAVRAVWGGGARRGAHAGRRCGHERLGRVLQPNYRVCCVTPCSRCFTFCSCHCSSSCCSSLLSSSRSSSCCGCSFSSCSFWCWSRLRCSCGSSCCRSSCGCSCSCSSVAPAVPVAGSAVSPVNAFVVSVVSAVGAAVETNTSTTTGTTTTTNTTNTTVTPSTTPTPSAAGGLLGSNLLSGGKSPFFIYVLRSGGAGGGSSPLIVAAPGMSDLSSLLETITQTTPATPIQPRELTVAVPPVTPPTRFHSLETITKTTPATPIQPREVTVAVPPVTSPTRFHSLETITQTTPATPVQPREVTVAVPPVTPPTVTSLEMAESAVPTMSPAGSDPQGPARWPSLYPTCSGPRQSPINIQTSNVSFRGFKGIALNFQPQTTSFSVKFDGYTVKMKPQSKMYVQGVGLPGQTYTVGDVHFHWSSVNLHGSEHSVDGVLFPLEHTVDSDVFRRYPYSILLTLKFSADDEVPIRGLDLRQLLPPRLDRFFRYHGSMTTPPCRENVTWTVCEHVQTVSSAQFRVFQNLRRVRLAGDDPVIDNTRPVQIANGRTVISTNPIFSQAPVSWG
ncbi:hypothetical protein ACOMHN_038326 [Nucella lapillus]